jgi:hypothetical protein
MSIPLTVVDIPTTSYCPVTFGMTFLNNVGANIDCKKHRVSLKFGEDEI